MSAFGGKADITRFGENETGSNLGYDELYDDLQLSVR
jgi:hypothetical protein